MRAMKIVDGPGADGSIQVQLGLSQAKRVDAHPSELRLSNHFAAEQATKRPRRSLRVRHHCRQMIEPHSSPHHRMATAP